MKLTAYALLAVTLALAACDRTSAPSTPTASITPMTLLTGAWHSTSTAGACTSTNWVVTPTGATTATITYTATCAGVPVTGTANGSLDGTTLNWTTTGAAATCPFTLAGTAVPAAVSTDLNIAYTGTVCGALVSGTDTLHR